MKRNMFIPVLFAIPLIGLDIALIVAGTITPVGVISTLGVFAAVIAAYWFFNLRGRRIEKDERTIRLTRKALAYSWLFTIYVVVLLTASESLGLLRLSSLQCLGLITMVMTFSFLILQLALNRRGDVE